MSNKQVDSLTKIDYSCLIGSQVLIEFRACDSSTFLEFLTVDNSVYRTNQIHRIYQHKDYWISNADGELVLPDGFVLNILFRCGEISKNYSSKSGRISLKSYSEKPTPDDIIALQVLGAASGYQE